MHGRVPLVSKKMVVLTCTVLSSLGMHGRLPVVSRKMVVLTCTVVKERGKALWGDLFPFSLPLDIIG
jgi:hypothetical protein